MKSIFLTLSFILAFTVMAYTQKRNIPVLELPKEVLNFVQVHFPEDGLLKLTEEKEGEIIKYEILIDNQTELEFDSNGNIVEIEGKEKLPDSVINPRILDYVNSNYPENFITGWKLKSDHQKIELDNDVDLKFTNEGEFIKIDK